MYKSTLLKQLNNITARLIEKYKPEKIILFGSAAWGEEEIHDIDLFIVKREVPYYGEGRIRELYRLMDTDAPVDYIVYKPEEVEERLALGDPFVKQIFKKGIILYG
ncbi:MAG: nucleotidyltransferase domain-containing protein [Candidatus Brocadia sp.]|nr:nucleotidyltransferase domain-containing protein [Candidatus Brocadia sp.]